MQSWYVVYTHPREEAVAEENLARQGFITYCPRYRKRVSHARKVHDVLACLFPRYLFIAFDPGAHGWRAIRSTRGVVDVVRSGHEPAPVAAELIALIRAREDVDGSVVLGRQIELQKGQRFRLRGGAFDAHELIFEARKDTDRVVALLSLLGREFTVEVPVAQILPAA